MAAKKTTINIDKPTVKLWQVLGIILLITFLLRFEMVAAPVAKIIAPNDPSMTDKLMDWGGIAQNLLIGWILISLGAKAMAIPWVGIPFIVVGAGLILYAAWRIYGRANQGNLNANK